MIKIYETLFAIINSLMVLIDWRRLGICVFGKALECNNNSNRVLGPDNDALKFKSELAMEAWIYSFGWKLNLNAIAQNKADGSNRRQYRFTVYGATETNR